MSECTPSKDHVCPECKQGKHRNCDGSAWCKALDESVRCVCAAGEHESNEAA